MMVKIGTVICSLLLVPTSATLVAKLHVDHIDEMNFNYKLSRKTTHRLMLRSKITRETLFGPEYNLDSNKAFFK